MATITTSPYYLDSAARTAGEVMTINGGQLVIRTDTRWHATAPASMTGTLGGSSIISATLGGEIFIDATKVRWMPITGGSGTCAIGTTITQGGVSGYFLGYWASLTAAPSTTIGATGFIKLREVSGGSFTAGALTGIIATASGPDVVGWIEVVADQVANFSVPRLGKFTTRGDWFDLGLTTGVAGQVVQFPTNGSATTYMGGVWIETSTPNEYDFYSAVYATGFTATNFGSDRRCRVVKMNTNGSIEIGTGGVGYTPPAGRKIRTSNIFLRQCTTAARATNAIPNATVATRPDFTTTSAGYIDVEMTNGDWYFSFSQPYYVKIKDTATHEGIVVSECATNVDISNGGAGTSAGLVGAGLVLTSCFSGGLIKDWVASGYSNAVTGGMLSLNYCIGQVVDNCKSGCWTYARSATKSYGYYVAYSSDITIKNSQSLNATNNITTSSNITVENFDYCDRYVGETNTTTGLYCWVVASRSSYISIDGITFGLEGTVANQHPYSGIISCTSSTDCKFRNFGIRSNFLSGGSVSTTSPAYIWADGGNNVNIKVQRCYLQPTRTAAHSSQNSSKNMLFEDVYGDWTDIVTMAGLNTLERGGSGINTTTGQASVYGTHFGGAFDSDTTGRMWLAMNEPTAETLQYCEMNFSAGSGFTSAGGLSLGTAGDYFICEMQENRLQTTGFANINPTLTGTNTGNHTFEYQLDKGSGWNGEWKTISGANLSAETIQPNIGYKLKFKITCTVSNSANLVSYVRCNTTSTLQAQVDNLYPLDTVTLALNNLEVGARVQVLADGLEVYNGLTGSSVNVDIPFYGTDIDTRIRIMFCNGLTAIKFIEFTELIGQYGLKKLISTELDNVYLTNGIDGSLVSTVIIDDSSLLVNVNDNAITWAEIYAYETYWLTTDEGIRDEGRFITAVDNANYILENFKIKNVGSSALVLTGGWAWDALTGKSIDLIDTTGNTIFSAPDHVVAYATGGSALTTEEHNKLMSGASKGDIWAAAVLGV